MAFRQKGLKDLFSSCPEFLRHPFKPEIFTDHTFEDYISTTQHRSAAPINMAATAGTQQRQQLIPVTSESEWQSINDELKENGVKVNVDIPGLAILRLTGLEMEMSPKVGVARFVVGENSIMAFGTLSGGMTCHLAACLSSIVGQHVANGQQVHAVELNANYLGALAAGEEMVVLVRPLSKGGRTQVWEVKCECKKKSKNGGPRETALGAVCTVTLLVGPAVEQVASNTHVAASRL